VIIDPHGQTTTISYPGDGSETITEPSGRWLKFFYIQTPWNGDTVIDHVVASDGRSVKYNYGGWQPDGTTNYTCLSNVQYLDPNGASYAQAIYAYQQDNTSPNGRPLILWAIDPMYMGRMWAISYSFVPVAAGAVYGQLQSENYLDPSTGTPGQAVSSLSGTGNSRTETRGDGPFRTFTYSGPLLVSYTDFKAQSSSISYDGHGFQASFTDARGKTTTTLREGRIGALSLLTHPDDEHSTQGYSYLNAEDAPYYLQIRGDERGHNTYFSRDPNNFQLTRIDYPDYPSGAYETFTYNGFGQVTTHRMTSGGTETNYYDGRGMMWAQTNPDGTAYFYYDSLDRLEHVVDRRGKTTWFQYNPRGQVTRVAHIDGSYVQYGYNVEGTLAWTADENHPGAASDANQRTRYAYDYYKRVVSVTNPLNQTTSLVYAQDWVNPYNQTTTSIKGAFSPMGKQVHFYLRRELAAHRHASAARVRPKRCLDALRLRRGGQPHLDPGPPRLRD
jgi:YD repeat-containing protein